MFLISQGLTLLLLINCATADSTTKRNLRRLQNVDSPIYPVKVDNSAADALLEGLTISTDAADIGMWSPVKDWSNVGAHAAVLPDGRVVTYGSSVRGETLEESREFSFWNPSLGLGGASTTVTKSSQLR
jgi:hypothetical protein